MNAPDPIELTQSLVRLNTINPPGHEDQCVELLADLLSPAGFDCRTHNYGPRRTSLVAKIGGKPGHRPLAFTGHMDVVPLGAKAWQHDPFAATIVGDQLLGRGSSDMKSGIAAFVSAAIAGADQWRDGPGLTLILTAGEETGCEGAFDLARTAPELLGKAGALIVGEPTSNEPLLGHKGAYWLKAQASGVTAHGSMPHLGENAIYKLARAALALEDFAFDTPAHPLMGAATLNVGTARGGININSVPDAAELTIDIRTVAEQDHAHIYRCLCNKLGGQIQLSTLLDVGSVYTAPTNAWMQDVFAVCGQHLGSTPVGKTVSYFTDAAALKAPLGAPPIVILGPGEAGMAHQTDEYCLVSRVHQGVAIYRDLITRYVDHANTFSSAS